MRGNGLHVVDLVTGRDRALASVSLQPQNPAPFLSWSPDGRWIAVGGTLVGAADGATCRPLGAVGSVQWRPHSQALIGDSAAGRFVIGEPGSVPRPLLQAGFSVGGFAFDRSGRRLVAEGPHASLWVFDLVSGKRTRIWRSPSASGRIGPPLGERWSADGRWILFETDPFQSASIAADGLPLWAVAASGGHPIEIEPALLGGADFLQPCGAHSGQVVISAGFDRYVSAHKRIDIAAPPRWKAQSIAADARYSWYAAACSPDGRLVAATVTANRDEGRFDSARRSIWLLTSTGSKRKRLVSDRHKSISDEQPRWSRDGHWLLYFQHPARADPKARLFLLNIKTGQRRGPFAQINGGLGYYGYHDWDELAPWYQGDVSRVRRATVFWAQSPHGGADERGSIGRADLSGSGADGRFIVGTKAPAGIAVSGHYIYWANYGSGTIARARLDGSDVTERFIKTGDEYAVLGIAVDGQHIYWTNSGFDANNGTISRANIDGSGVNQHFIKAGDSPAGLAVDRHHIYWTHRDFRVNKFGGSLSYAIGRANLDGSGVNRYFIEASNVLDGVAVNDHYVFWSNDGEHAIGRANLDGTHVSQRCISVQTAPLETVPEGLATGDQRVYWTNYPADTIARANLDGSDVNDHFIAVRGVPEGIAVAVSVGARSSRSTAGGCDSSKAPLLLGPTTQSVGYYASGWGQVAPAVISNGGAAASGTISDIHWRAWGGKVAVGRGLNPTYRPQGGYYRKPVTIELRASAIRRCAPGGRLVYTRFTAREQVRPGGPMGKWFAWAANMCVGFR